MKSINKIFSIEVVNNILVSLKNKKFPLKIIVSKLDIKTKNTSIDFLNQTNEILIKNDVLMKYNWFAQISNIRIKDISIPSLNYEENGTMTIDITIHPFKIKSIFEKENI